MTELWHAMTRPSDAVVFCVALLFAVLFVATDYTVRRIMRNLRRANRPLNYQAARMLDRRTSGSRME